MATRTPKVLAEGQVANSKGTLYTVPANTTTYITSMFFTNINAASQTLRIYYKPGSTSRERYHNGTMAQWTTVDFSSGDILQADDLIEAETTTASAVDYVIMGIEET